MTVDADRYRENFIEEINAAYLYRVAADLEGDETLSGVYRRLAETEEKHVALWQEQLERVAAAVPPRSPMAAPACLRGSHVASVRVFWHKSWPRRRCRGERCTTTSQRQPVRRCPPTSAAMR
jgi:hypothetical protein